VGLFFKNNFIFCSIIAIHELVVFRGAQITCPSLNYGVFTVNIDVFCVVVFRVLKNINKKSLLKTQQISSPL